MSPDCRRSAGQGGAPEPQNGAVPHGRNAEPSRGRGCQVRAGQTVYDDERRDFETDVDFDTDFDFDEDGEEP
jgi:hypothetical protein